MVNLLVVKGDNKKGIIFIFIFGILIFFDNFFFEILK